VPDELWPTFLVKLRENRKNGMSLNEAWMRIRDTWKEYSDWVKEAEAKLKKALQEVSEWMANTAAKSSAVPPQHGVQYSNIPPTQRGVIDVRCTACHDPINMEDFRGSQIHSLSLRRFKRQGTCQQCQDRNGDDLFPTYDGERRVQKFPPRPTIQGMTPGNPVGDKIVDGKKEKIPKTPMELLQEQVRTQMIAEYKRKWSGTSPPSQERDARHTRYQSTTTNNNRTKLNSPP